MVLKEIKDGMLIRCRTKEEAEKLVSLTESNINYVKFWDVHENNTVYKVLNGKIASYGNKPYYNETLIYDFSEFIIQEESELTAEELLKIIKEICEKNLCDDKCLFRDSEVGCIMRNAIFNPKKIIEVCKQWKADHEKKEPEVEWVDLCRIIEIKEDGVKECVYEEEIEKVLPFGGYEKDEIEKIFKRYCVEHEENFFATHEIVCRVKK